MRNYFGSTLNFGKDFFFYHTYIKRSELSFYNTYFCFEKYEMFRHVFYMLNNNNIFKIMFFLNLLFYQLIFCYRGFRFFFNLPVRGQRTWSNGKATNYLNKKFLIFRYFFFKKQFINLNFNSMYFMFFLEFLNLFWKLNFFEEWLYCYVHIMKKVKTNQSCGVFDVKSKTSFIKDHLYFNLLSLKNKTFKFGGNINTIGFLPGKYRIIILN